MTQDHAPKGEPGINLEHQAEAVRDSAVQFAKDAKHETEAALESAHDFLRRQWNERPLTVAALAIGFGALIGLALSKRR